MFLSFETKTKILYECSKAITKLLIKTGLYIVPTIIGLNTLYIT